MIPTANFLFVSVREAMVMISEAVVTDFLSMDLDFPKWRVLVVEFLDE